MTNNKIDILIIEDSQTQAMHLQFILEGFGYGAVVAQNGMQGLELLKKSFFPIVITDWMMPEMDGFEFCQTVRQQDFPGYVYLIILTAKDTKTDIIAGLEAGADDYLIKPVDKAELAARLNTAKRIIRLEHSLRKRNEEIALLSVTDPLTKIYNRRYLNEHLPTALAYSSRYNHPFSLMIADIDFFKNINDRYGHLTGDRVLESFARFLKRCIREDVDWMARYGGEEFVIVLPETNVSGAQRAAERYRNLIAETTLLTEPEPICITASFGVACVYPSGEGKQITPEALIESADQCLYRAKKEGRNRCFAILLE
ncbi:MAG: hypothetical protein BWK80_31560 [Desulfobacteraceae bacterium IS3]|nr:MAG: hypothetical protein BWK80_31560 [Desulfobacteraceae bacterium IS3]